MGDGGNEAQVVLADAQFGIVQVMRPVTDFESTYDGTTADRPVYLFPDGENIDKIAAEGIAGYAPNLARGLKVPLGARIVLWFPNLFYPDGMDTLGYEWILIWRMRNVFDFRQARLPYHLSRDQGAPDTSGAGDPVPRVPLPAAYNTITYIQTEPITQLGRAVNNIHSEDLEASTESLLGPLLPDGSTQPIQQGIVDPASVTDADRPTFMTHDVQAIGDELLVGVRRSSASIADWDFSGADSRFSEFLGGGSGDEFPNVGVYVLSGAAP